MLLYIIRHGDPDYKNDCLTERGRLQAEALGKRLFDAKIDRVFSSPMGRAQETAEPTCRLLGLEKNIEPWAHEIGQERFTSFPDGVQKSVTFVQSTYYRKNGYIDYPYDKAFETPGFSDSQLKQKVSSIADDSRNFLERMGYKEENGVYRILRKNEEKVAFFCHYSFGKSWLSTLLHIPIHIMWGGFDFTHTGVTVLEFANNENGVTAPRCLCFSDVSHLYANNLDLIIHNRTEI